MNISLESSDMQMFLYARLCINSCYCISAHMFDTGCMKSSNVYIIFNIPFFFPPLTKYTDIEHPVVCYIMLYIPHLMVQFDINWGLGF